MGNILNGEVSKIWLALAIVICLSSGVPAQQKRPIHLGLKLHPKGWILPHSDEIRSLTNDRIAGIQAEISRFNFSQKSWESCRCFAKSGIGLSYHDFANRDQLGSAASFYYFVEPNISINKRLFFTYRAGLGLSYLSRTFDASTNPENQFFSSPISGLLFVGLRANYELTEKWLINTGVSYNHISNGGLRQPNLGMNFPTISVGMDYIMRPLVDPVSRFSNVVFDLKGRINADLIWTMKTVEEEGDFGEEQLPVFGLMISYSKPFSSTNAVTFGAEWLVDESWKVRSERVGDVVSPHFLSLLLGHHFLFGSFSFGQLLGIYALREFDRLPADIYQRYVLDYTTSSGLRIGFSLKAHGHVAEILDLRIGYRW